MKSETITLKQRALEASRKLNKHWKSDFLLMFPEYNNKEGLEKISNVANGRQADDQVTIDLETFINK